LGVGGWQVVELTVTDDEGVSGHDYHQRKDYTNPVANANGSYAVTPGGSAAFTSAGSRIPTAAASRTNGVTTASDLHGRQSNLSYDTLYNSVGPTRPAGRSV